jgi:hypothetical protein
MNKTTKILNEVKTLLGMEVKLAQMQLDNGTVLEADAFEAGNNVMIVTADGNVALPIGEYTLEDGRILVCEQEGVIMDINDAQTEEAMPESNHPAAEAAEPQMAMEEQTPSAKKIIETISKESFFSEIETLKKENLELKEQLLKLSEVKEEVVVENNEPAAEPIAFNPENKKPVQLMQYGKNRPKTIMDSVISKIAN